MTSPKILDLDARLGLNQEDDAPVHIRPFKMFGRTWTLVCDVNPFAMNELMAGDAAAVVRFVDSLIAEHERIDFRLALSRVKNLTVEKLIEIINAMTEAASEDFPTTPSSASSRGVPPRKSGPKSAASSSPRRAGR